MRDVKQPYEKNLPETQKIGTMEIDEWMIILPSLTLDDLETANIETAYIRTSTMMRVSKEFSKPYLDKIKDNVKEMCTKLNPEYAKYFQPFVGIDCHVGNSVASSSSFVLVNVRILKRLWAALHRKKSFLVHHWLLEDNGHLIRFDTSPNGLVSTSIDKHPYRHYSGVFLQGLINKSTVLQHLGAHVCHLGREVSEKKVCLL